MKCRRSSQTHVKIPTSFKVFIGCTVVILLTVGPMRLGSGERRARAETSRAPAKSVGMLEGSRSKQIPVVPDPADTPHKLAATYYSSKPGLSAILMLSNQGPHQIEVQPTLFSLTGERFDAPPRVLEATTPYSLDIGEWVTMAGLPFQEGSLQISYVGKGMEIGGVVQLVQASQSLSFDEEVTEPALRFLSSRLEGVWSFPSRGAEMLMVVSNTSDLPVVATLDVSGNEPKRIEATTVSLTPHESRRISLRDLVGKQGEALPKFGGISITHSGTPGAVIARGMIDDEATGFSSVVDFSDPGLGKSTRIDGAGLRVGRIGNEELSQIVVARNTDEVPTTLIGRIPYTKNNGATGVISLPQVRFTVGETKVIDASDAIRRSGIKGIAIAGLEFEYSSAPGSMVMSAYSISSSGNHTFRVLLMDAASLPSSAGTYPWSITADSSTIVYIKNVTGEPQDCIMTIRYGAVTDGYSPPIQTITPGQTVAIDLRKLRDRQVPDGYGRTLPLDANGGQVHWSARGRTRLPMIGRAEQVSISAGLSMTAACGEPCCGDMFAGGFVSPGGVFGFTGASTTFVANEQWQDCWGSLFTGAAPAVFSSSNPAVATCDAGGNATGVGPGSASIIATWHYFSNRPSGDPYTPQCFTEEGDTSAEALCDIGSLVQFVVSPSVSGDGDAVIAGQRFSFRVEARRPDGTRATEVDGNAAFNVEGTAGSGEVIPGEINIVAGAGSADITLQKVLHTGDAGRTYHVTLLWGGGSANVGGTFNVYFSVTMDVERWKNCNFLNCPNLGSYFCMRGCDPFTGFSAPTSFVSLPDNSACGAFVRVVNAETGQFGGTNVSDIGPAPLGNRYWLTGNTPSGIGGCLSDNFATLLGIDNGCNPNHGEGRVYWRFIPQ